MLFHRVVNRAVTTAALGAVVAALCAFGTTQASADTSLGNRIAAIADANLGKTACSANSTGQGGVPNAADGFGTSCSGEEWCADFAKWSWNQAGYTDTTDISAAAYTFARHGAANSTFHWIYDTSYTPQPGNGHELSVSVR
ncbi:MAG TPA: hypothetical protein VEO01_11675 [Pseudonocardiaceae bacterium]|nr:hypothetical protein [Pseudonocardiaceae bacterium]